MSLPGRIGGFLGRGERRESRPTDHAGSSLPWLAIRVAMAAAAVVGVAYVVIAAAVVAFATNSLTADLDSQLARQLAPVPNLPGDQPFGPGGQAERPFGPPVLMWRLSPDGTVDKLNTTIDLPPAYQQATGPETVTISGVAVRIEGARRGSDYVVVGMTMDTVDQTVSALEVAELGIGCALLIFVFLGALAVGWRVAAPIERARQRQLEFTADASHELRTPLSVVEAQTSLALARARDRRWDSTAFARIDAELRRMRRLLDDMLWLARFDASASQPSAEPVDLAVLAAQTADRFAAVAESRHQKLTVETPDGDQSPVVAAPPEWLDRLVGVLLDNACKYSPDGGSIALSVAAEGRRARLTVDDSGPGIPAEERARVFDRFHRATDAPGGAGLGLAIAGEIGHSTGGRWAIGESPLGGARVSITWPRALGGR
jgi:signal transduction histidine kinase